jgi:sterol desaturase/sphingolipid hydroxylase (fatty acid hydroxylase superfamily)
VDTLVRHTSDAYAIAYFGVAIVVSLLEWAIPRRQASDALSVRWIGNIGITVLNTILLRSLFPMLGLAWAMFCREHGWGLFNQIGVHGLAAFLLTLLVLDAVAYSQHWLFHRVPTLWRLHCTHHSDQEYDFTTGLRFHPMEAVVETVIGLGAILALGASPGGVLVSQLLSIGIGFVEHANVRMPASLDRVVRLFLVTPDMHRIHHSQNGRESRSNLGNAFPWWDRLFRTYVDQPAAGHEGIAFGLSEFPERKHLTLPWMLAQPFLRPQRRMAPATGK